MTPSEFLAQLHREQIARVVDCLSPDELARVSVYAEKLGLVKSLLELHDKTPLCDVWPVFNKTLRATLRQIDALPEEEEAAKLRAKEEAQRVAEKQKLAAEDRLNLLNKFEAAAIIVGGAVAVFAPNLSLRIMGAALAGVCGMRHGFFTKLFAPFPQRAEGQKAERKNQKESGVARRRQLVAPRKSRGAICNARFRSTLNF